MRKIPIAMLLAAAVAAALALTSCPLISVGGSAPKTVISVNLCPVAPVISGLLHQIAVWKYKHTPPAGRRVPPTWPGASTGAKGAQLIAATAPKGAGPKAYLAADTVHFTLLNSLNQQVAAWDHTPEIDVFTQAQNNGSSDISLPVPEQSVPAGTYTLKAEIFNNQTSTTAPVVAGTASVVVAPNSVTPVTVRCVPVNPETLSVEDTAGVTLIPWDLSSPVYVNYYGAEHWYQISLEAGLFYEAYVQLEGGQPGDDAYAVVYDSSGNLVTAGGATSMEYSSPIIAAETTGTYYIGVFCFSTIGSLEDKTVDLTVSAVEEPSGPDLSFDSVAENYDFATQQVALSFYWGPANDLRVLRSTDAGFTNPVDVANVGDNYFYDSDGTFWFYDYTALLGQTYYYKLAAFSLNTLEWSVYSSIVTASYAAPASVVATSSTAGTQVSWGAVGAPDYYYEVLDSIGQVIYSSNTTSTSVLLTTQLEIGQVYYIAVQGYNSEMGYLGYVSMSNAVTHLGNGL